MASAFSRTSPYDRQIFRLALPALGALAAEPIYLLIDTAIVGHLGTPQLAGLALAGAILNGAFALCNFLVYGTTAQVARLHGAGREREAGALAAQALWLASTIGAVLVIVLEAVGAPLVHAFGGAHHTLELAIGYLRIGALGLPCALIALAGQGYLRGVSDLRSPLLIVVAANLLNVVLEILFIYGFGWGLAGSAAGTVLAQAAMAAAFVRLLLAAPADDRRPRAHLMRPLTQVSGDIFVRTGALYAAFLLASAVLARVGAASLGAHQVAFELWGFLALILDSVAIAGQVIVGRSLGAGRAADAWEAASRMLVLSLALGVVLAVGMLVLSGTLPRIFTGDPRVIDRLAVIWPIYALMQPVNALVFALDGILIGAGDTRFLKWSMVFAALGVFVPLLLLSSAEGWGILGVWLGLLALILARLLTCGGRFLTRRWAVVGVLG